MNYETFELERWMTYWELQVSHDICESGIRPLTLTDVLTLLPDEAASSLRESLHSVPLGYSEARGTIELRTALANTYEKTTAEEIFVATGAIEANFLLFNVLVQPGDHVIVVDPAYQQLQSVPKALGADVELLSVVHDDGYYYDLDELRAMVRPNTKLIVVNTPHNPTGAMLSEDQIIELIDIAKESDAWILSDEAYRWIEHPGGETIPAPMRGRYEKGISVGTVSKPFGVPGLRIGWFAAPAEITQAAWAVRDYVSLSPGKLSDLITTAIVTHKDAIFARNDEIIGTNLQTANTWFAAHSDLVNWVPPRAGLLAMMGYTADIDSRTLGDRLAGEAGVMLAPGDAFGMPGRLRIGIGQDPAIFREGLKRTSDFLKKL